MNKNIIILGAGGHSKVILDLIEQNGWDFCGFIDKKSKGMPKLNENLVIGDDNDLSELFAKGIKYAALGIGHVGNFDTRNEVYYKLKAIGYILPNLMHPNAVISKTVKMGEGNVFMAGSIVNAWASIGDISIVNTHATIEHGVILEDNSHVAPGAVILGDAHIERNAFIGAGSIIVQGITVGEECIIGAGSVIIKNAEKRTVMVGNPGRVIKRR